LVVDARRLGKLLGAGLRTVRTWDYAGRLPPPLKIGGRVVWVVAEIKAWLAAGVPSRAEWEATKRRDRR
jgi:predicted DNA-binding transcriptional regulator AlpA